MQGFSNKSSAYLGAVMLQVDCNVELQSSIWQLRSLLRAFAQIHDAFHVKAKEFLFDQGFHSVF